jgi:hypothetical protein
MIAIRVARVVRPTLARHASLHLKTRAPLLTHRALLSTRAPLHLAASRHVRPPQHIGHTLARCLATVDVLAKKPEAATPPPPFDPNKTLSNVRDLGVAQRARGSDQLFVSSFLGGAMLSWGSILMMVVAGGAPSLAGDPGLQALVRGVVFPVGLSLIVLSKSELVTANFLSQALPAPSVDALRVLSVSFAANLAGSLAMVGAASVAGVFTPGAAAMLVKARDRCRIQKPRRLLIVGSMVASPPRSRRPK